MQDNLESAVEFLPRPRQQGLSLVARWFRPIPAEMAPSFAGPDTHQNLRGKPFWIEGCDGLAGRGVFSSPWPTASGRFRSRPQLDGDVPQTGSENTSPLRIWGW